MDKMDKILQSPWIPGHNYIGNKGELDIRNDTHNVNNAHV